MSSAGLPKYTVLVGGRLFWQPKPAMRRAGFQSLALGEDTPANRARAQKMVEAWEEFRDHKPRVTSYPPGTFGAFYDRFRRSPTFGRKDLRTREDYARAWRYIDGWRPDPESPTLSRTVITRIGTELCELFYDHLHRTVSPNERHRTIKVLKILLTDMVVRLRLDYASPAANLTNPQPAGRWQIWLGAEIEDLVVTAAIGGFEAMSLAIEVAWETMFSPVDVRTLRPRQLKRDGQGWYFHRSRTKTEAEAFGYISDPLADRLLAYIAGQARSEADDTPIFRTRPVSAGPEGGRPREPIAYRNRHVFAKDFRLVREIAFPGDRRQLLDIRRSANVEADAAGADKATMGELLANGLADNRFLDETYTPPTVAKAREVAALRLKGRVKLAGEAKRLKAS